MIQVRSCSTLSFQSSPTEDNALQYAELTFETEDEDQRLHIDNKTYGFAASSQVTEDPDNRNRSMTSHPVDVSNENDVNIIPLRDDIVEVTHGVSLSPRGKRVRK